MKFFQAQRLAQFATQAFAAAGLDIEAAMATENVDFLTEAITDSAAASERIAELEAVSADLDTLKAEHEILKGDADQLHAALTKAGIDHEAEDLGAEIEAHASTKAAELAAAQGIKPLEAHVTTDDSDKAHGPAEIYAHYKTLSGADKATYYAEHKDAIWAGKAAE